MTIQSYVRLISGTLVLLSLALGFWLSPLWYCFTALLGFALVQSAFTHWCPMVTLLRKLGVEDS